MIKSGLLIGAAGLALTACSEAEDTPSQTQESDALIVITADGEIVTLATEIDASAVLRKSKTLGKAKDANACVVSEGQVLTLSGNTLSNTGGKRITVDAAANGLAIFKSGAETYLAIARPESPVLSLYAADTLSPAGSFDIVCQRTG